MSQLRNKLKRFLKLKNLLRLVWISGLFASLLNCSIGSSGGGGVYRLGARPLSHYNGHLVTCVFEPNYPIVHFPMWHHPPSQRHYTAQEYETVSMSQFQLLHTILDYNRSPIDLLVFDEGAVSDVFNEDYFQRLTSGQADGDSYTRMDGKQFFITERQTTANQLFPNKFYPPHYENLSPGQKDFLFHTGASMTLYLTGELPRIHKVITARDFEYVRAQLQGLAGGLQLAVQQKNHFIFGFREQKLRDEVLSYYFNNAGRGGTVYLIAYGASHDFSDDFRGYPFQSGHQSCVNWSPWRQNLRTTALY